MSAEMERWLASAFRAAEQASGSRSRQRYLERLALAQAWGSAMPAAEPNPLEEVERILTEVQVWAHLTERPSVQHAKQLLRAQGQTGARIACRVGRLSTARNAAAHPGRVIADLRKFVTGRGDDAGSELDDSVGEGSGSASPPSVEVTTLDVAADEYFGVTLDCAGVQTEVRTASVDVQTEVSFLPNDEVFVGGSPRKSDVVGVDALLACDEGLEIGAMGAEPGPKPLGGPAKANELDCDAAAGVAALASVRYRVCGDAVGAVGVTRVGRWRKSQRLGHLEAVDNVGLDENVVRVSESLEPQVQPVLGLKSAELFELPLDVMGDAKDLSSGDVVQCEINRPQVGAWADALDDEASEPEVNPSAMLRGKFAHNNPWDALASDDDGVCVDAGAHWAPRSADEEAVWKKIERHVRTLLDAGDVAGAQRFQRQFEQFARLRRESDRQQSLNNR